MYLVELWRSLRRRWWIVLIGLVATALLSVGMYRIVPVTYTATAMHLLLPPPDMIDTDGDGIPDKVVPSNPYLNLGGLDQAVTILVSRLNSQAVHGQLTATATGGSDYSAIDTGQAAPIVEIDVTSNDQAAATRLLASVNASVSAQLTMMQSDLSVPKDSLITAFVLTADPQPTVVSKARLQATIGTLVVGIILSIIVAAVVDGLVTRRRSRTTAPLEYGEELEADDRGLPRADMALPLPAHEASNTESALLSGTVAGHSIVPLHTVEQGLAPK